MNVEVEELLRDGMERFTAEVRAPRGRGGAAAGCGGQTARRALVAGGAETATAAAVIIATAAAGGPGADGQRLARPGRRDVDTRVENALASEHDVYRGVTMSTGGQSSVTWATAAERSRSSREASGQVSCQRGLHERRRIRALPGTGTALTWQHTGAYVAYYDQTYRLGKYVYSARGAAARRRSWRRPARRRAPRLGRLHQGSPGLRVRHGDGAGADQWRGDTKITGKPVTVRLSGAYGKVVHERYARGLWTLYVNPRTYLPVRTITATETFGGAGGHTRSRP